MTRGPRAKRGVTLVEMLVTVAVLVIMMTILVQIFQAATGSVSAAQAYQQLDDQLRRIDGIIRADFEGATARFTPPLDPSQNLGYFEYGENEFADNQGEDSDDYVRFTVKAPAGQPFTGRFWPILWTNTTNAQQIFQPVPANSQQGVPGNLGSFPITISSDYAEVIYFLRNGNLYRRVFLIAPELQSSIWQQSNGSSALTFQPSVFGGPGTSNPYVSWQGVNDLSARPSPTGPANFNPTGSIVLNTLGDLTNRENRAFSPRYANDFVSPSATAAAGYTVATDGIPDDSNGDSIPDLYPSLYPGIFSPTNAAGQLVFAAPVSTANPSAGAALLSGYPGMTYLGFPFIFPGAYSKAQALNSDQAGWIHAPAPYAVDAASPPNPYQYDSNPVQYLQYLNHNPLDVGDNLPTPPANVAVATVNTSETQTWWGFPTWRETLSQYWHDPYWQCNVANSWPNGLNPYLMNISSGVLSTNANVLANALPPMAIPQGFTGNFSIYRPTQQLFCDGAGGSSAFMDSQLWPLSWEDDLILTNVRSFDVKVYDNALANYADLGWGDDYRLYTPYLGSSNYSGATYANSGSLPVPPLYLYSTPPPLVPLVWPPATNNSVIGYSTLSTFAHEGRMPPLQADNRLDYQNPNLTYQNQTTFYPQYPLYNQNYSSNVGDDSAGIPRLRRVYDTWSTEYAMAPANGVNSPASGAGGFPIGPPFSPPVYPSYPPPYPAPLRGIQIQIRVADPTNQRIKQLTIRQDFTDKL